MTEMIRFPVRTYRQGDVLFREGDFGKDAFIVKKGAVEIQVCQDDRKIVLTTLKPGAIFGEMALILKDHCRTATAVVTEESEIISFDKRVLDAHLQRSPLIVSSLLNSLAERLQQTTQQLLSPPRLFGSVCRMLHLLSLHAEEIRCKETVEALSSALRAEEKSVEDCFETLRGTGLIEISGGVIRIKERDEFLTRTSNLQQYLKLT